MCVCVCVCVGVSGEEKGGRGETDFADDAVAIVVEDEDGADCVQRRLLNGRR